MDTGLRGRRALVAASSRGLGYACAEALAAEGVDICLNGRDEAALKRATDTLRVRHTAVEVQAIAADVSTPEGRRRMLDGAGEIDILVTNVGGLSLKSAAEMTDEDWLASVHALMLPPISLITELLPGMMARRWGRIVNLTSSAVKSPIVGLVSSTACRLGLTGYVATSARRAIRAGVTINNILPGRIMTDRQRAAIRREALRADVTVEEQQKRMAQAIPAGRIGDADEIGALCAFLCSERAGYITGQNIVVDGGAYTGTF